ncbi:MAG: ClpXP protease specificity-enhancing factor [Burkholderiales bacterium]|nr:ClpXP protease specificity-enhancing factor [Burkholderiales bacterium]
MPEIPTKPYLLRALYEWCVDNGYTPHLGVRTDARTQVPAEHVRNGEITLNVSPTAVHRLQMGNELIEFSARFAGVARQISVPVANVFALYARETGHGMTFDVDAPKAGVLAKAESETGALLPAAKKDAVPAKPSEPPVPTSPTKPRGGGRPTLRRIK